MRHKPKSLCIVCYTREKRRLKATCSDKCQTIYNRNQVSELTKLIPNMKHSVVIIGLFALSAFAQPQPPMPLFKTSAPAPVVVTKDSRTDIVYSVVIETNMVYREPGPVPNRSSFGMTFPHTNVVVEHFEVSSNNLMHVVFDGQKSHVAKNSTVLRKFKVTTTNIITAVTNSVSKETPE